MTEYLDSQLRLTEYAGSELTDRIELLLCDMGMMPRLKGYRCLCRAIELVYIEPGAIQNVMQGLYSRIAEETGTTPFCVERNCRTAIKLLWKNTEQTILGNYFFRYYGEAPAVREFVAQLADRLRRNLI